MIFSFVDFDLHPGDCVQKITVMVVNRDGSHSANPRRCNNETIQPFNESHPWLEDLSKFLTSPF